MDNPNQHITDYLNYYCSFDQEPEYAVLLKGKWGVGKTWFIKNHFAASDDKKKTHLSWIFHETVLATV